MGEKPSLALLLGLASPRGLFMPLRQPLPLPALHRLHLTRAGSVSSRVVARLSAYCSSSCATSERWSTIGAPVDCIRDAVLTVSPKRENCGFFEPTTPAITGPQCIPRRKRSAVPSLSDNFAASLMHSAAMAATAAACKPWRCSPPTAM
eukprot:4132803-Pleurochrysis_carterae.AAC.1